MKSSDVNMLSGSIFKGLIKISIPIMLMNVLQSIISLVDMAVLGVMVNDDAVGAVGASSTLITLVTGLLIGISVGTNVVVSKYIGKNDKERALKATGTSIFFALIAGIILMLIGLVGANAFIRLMNCPEELFVDAVKYFRIYFLSVPAIMLYNFCASVLRATGDSKRPMYFLTIAGIVKVALNFFLLLFTDMTVEGVGIATIVSFTLSGGLCLYTLCKNKGFVQFKFKYFKLYKHELKAVLKIGIPAGIQTGMYAIANVIIASTVNKFGPSATKGVSIANTYDGILYQIAIAPSLAVMPFVSQNVANGNINRAKESFYKSTLITIILGASFGALSALFSRPLSSIISQNPEVIDYSRQKMIIISSTYFICGINEIFCASLRGLGKSILPTICATIYLCLIRFVWVYVFFPLCPNLTFLYLIWPIGWTLSIFTLFIPLFKSFNKAKQKTLN